MKKMKKVLITGGAGFIGYHLSNYLSALNYDVVILDNFTRSEIDDDLKTLLNKDNVSLIEGNVANYSTFKKLNNDFDYIYHLAAINGTGNFYTIPDKVLEVGVLGTLNILKWFVKQKKGKLLFSSSSETYAGALKLMGNDFPIPTPEDVPLVVEDVTNVRWSYGGSKILSEIAFFAYEKAHNMKNFSIVRYHNIYGPRMGFKHVVPQFIERIESKENPFTLYGGNETRSFCYVDDAVEATRMIMESEKTNGEIIHIGRDDDEISIKKLAKELFNIKNIDIPFDIKPAPDGSVSRRCPDITKLKKLGYDPKVDLTEGLINCYQWYKDKFDNTMEDCK